MKLPFFSLNNYTSLMHEDYEDIDTSSRFSFRDLLNLRQESFLQRFSQVDAKKLSNYITEHPLHDNCKIGNKIYTLTDALIASKLVMPTAYACNYFFWNQGLGDHRGIDIIMPHHTPISSLTRGTVSRIKTWDGSNNNEGNCIVIHTPDNYYICYEHLATINVALRQSVNQSTIIGTCGKTGNSTQYHAHIQVDSSLAPFHPYRHAQTTHLYDYTINPLTYLRNRHPQTPFTDLPLIGEEQEAILRLEKQGIVKGFEKQCFPENYLQRYEMVLLIDRVLTLQNMYASLPIKNPTFQSYDDVHDADPELHQALQRLQKYGIMKGHDGHFYPYKKLKGEELLALLGRIFFHLEDATQGERRQPYVDKFIQEFLILSSRGYIRHAIPRKEVFTLLRKLLNKQ